MPNTLFDLCNCSNLQYQWRRNGVNIPGATNNSYSILNVQATNGGAYTVTVADGNEVVSSTPVSLTANVLLEVADDIVLNLISLTSGVLRSATTSATKLAGEPTILPGHPGGHPIWFKWTPLFSGIVTFTTSGSDFETMLGAYTGANVTNVTAVPSAVNNANGAGYHNSKISFNATALTTYQIVVDGYHGETGNVVFTWSENITSDTLATFSNKPPADTAVAPNTAFAFSAPHNNGTLDWLLNGHPLNIATSTITVNQATDSTVGRYVAQVTSASGNVTTTQEADLQTSVLQDGTTATNVFAFDNFLDAAASPAVAQSVVLTPADARRLNGGDTRGYSVSQVFSTVGATSEPGEPTPGNQVGGAPEWYSYVAPTSGSLYVTTAGSSFNTILGVYVGPGNSFSTLTNIGCGYTTNFQINGQPDIFIPNVTANQTYYIVVDGENGASGTVHLFVGAGVPVTATNDPEDQAIVIGNNATFSITASGSTPISYFWRVNGSNIPGATNSTFTITNAQLAQQGNYMVTVSNVVGPENFSAMLSFLQPPQITNQPAGMEVAAGANAAFSVGAGGSIPLNYQWMVGITPVAGATNSTLVLTNVQGVNAGSVSCLVANPAGQIASSNAVLTVDTAPTIAIPPLSQTVASNAAVTLNVYGAGTPAPSYQWFFNGAPTGTNGSQLTIPNFRASNEGSYRVVASNYLNTATSPAATLLLNSPLRLQSFLLTSNSLQFQLAGSSGSNYVIQSSSNLFQWTPILTNTAPSGLFNFTATNLTGFPLQFYRAVGQ
jgi:Immunoglobulin domain/Immunoglobulin I-set domain